MEGERREEQRLRIIFAVTDQASDPFTQCGGVCFNYSIVPCEIIKLKYILSRIIVVARQIGEWAGPIAGWASH